MKAKSCLSIGLVLVLFLLNSCKEDEAPKLQFSFENKTYSLKGAKIYLTYEGTSNGHTYRDYIISDGDFTNATGSGGWDLDDFNNATYYLAVELAPPVGGTFIPGSFPTSSSWGSTAATDRISYISFSSGENEAYIEYLSAELNEDVPVVVSGGFEDGDKITIKFSGSLTFYHKVDANWVNDQVTGKFYYSGPVQDER